MEEVLRCKIEDERGLQMSPFLGSATLHWLSHAKMVEAEEVPQGDLLGLSQWPSNQILQYWAQVHSNFDSEFRSPMSLYPATDRTLLHIASWLGFFSVVAAVLSSEGNASADTKDSTGRRHCQWRRRTDMRR